ncbi:MAG: DNA-3-methyladenine glycosylase I [Rhodocyclaceae bacterium]|nr:DNA-3-methyladenine glycosylase I [Rhodocyclaceae bacterium]
MAKLPEPPGGDLAHASGLGPKSAQMLARIGITRLAQVAELGVPEVLRKLLEAGQNPTLNLAYALAGALENIPWQQVARSQRATLGLQVAALREAAAAARQPRCAWCLADADYIAYHDQEWGVPERDDHRLFELLTLEGAQAGLSWLTVLRKREGYRAAFAQFDPVRVAAFGTADVEAILQSPQVVRHRGKIESTVSNARAVLAVQQEFGSLADFLWGFVDGKPIINRWRSLDEIPASTDRSQALSCALRKRGFNFVGPTICYAFMQAAGLVCDHLVDCFRYRELAGRAARRPGPHA